MPLGTLIDTMVGRDLDVVAVADSAGVVVGYADRSSVMGLLSRLFPQLEESTELTIATSASRYSASAIARAVEDVDAHLLNLNVVAADNDSGVTTVEIRVNHSQGLSVARSLERYGYDVVAMTSSSTDSDSLDDTTAMRARALLHYLEI
jgi:hypothetical protein